MMVPGYCTGCHRIRPVTVTGNGLVMAAATRSLVQGLCADCDDSDPRRRS
jgi:hypothetical protein